METALDLPLPELAAILARADLFLGHDSGVSHIAAAAGARALLLFGPSDPDIWAPPSKKVRVLRAPGEDLSRLGVEAVEGALREMLELRD